jgi:hypothetical protein
MNSDSNHHQVPLSETSIMLRLNLLDKNSVIVYDECDQLITPVLTIDVQTGDCLVDEYVERRVYTWVATDACGNSSSLSFTVDIIDDVPPEMLTGPADTTIVCVELPSAPDMGVDSSAGETVVFTEVINPGENPNEFIVTRTWLATDLCGNTSEVTQHILWIPETLLECEILLPGTVFCNSHDVRIESIVTGSYGPYTYEWEVIGDKCFIQGGQGTPNITIYTGWEDTKVILTVTDAFGCVSMCMITIDCEPRNNAISSETYDAHTLRTRTDRLGPLADLRMSLKSGETLSQLISWPNPTSGDITLRFEAAMDQQVEFSLINSLGQKVLQQQIRALKGANTSQVNLGHLVPGRYLIQLKTQRELHTSVLVFQ